MNKIVVSLVFFLIVSNIFSFTIEEIERLREMGFSHEQILKLAESGENASNIESESGYNKAEFSIGPVSSVSGDTFLMQKMTGLHKHGMGLLVVCFTREWDDRGPGYLDLWAQKAGLSSKKICEVPVVEYFSDGRKGPTKYRTINLDNEYLANIVVSETSDLVTSRYFAEIPIDAGNFEFMAKRKFKSFSEINQYTTWQTRHKKFHKVNIKPGKVTILSYFWGNNLEFGLDHVMPVYHSKFVNIIAERYGNFLEEIKIQRNK